MLKPLNLLDQQNAKAQRQPFNLSVLLAVLRGNKRGGLGRERYRVFPEHSSESRNPQRVPRVKR